MQENIRFLGLDGCRTGWIGFLIDENGKGYFHLFPKIDEVIPILKNPAFRQALIDIPIGLPHQKKRLCDAAARKVLTRKRGSSVFPIPSRKALQADHYLGACEINLELMGTKLSRQTWNIRNKILEVDSFLRTYPGFHSLLRECHPEVAFWAINGEAPMNHNKKTLEGIEERLGALERAYPNTRASESTGRQIFPRKEVSRDDLIDAMILAISAQMPLKTLPPNPESDLVGLPMEIVFPVF